MLWRFVLLGTLLSAARVADAAEFHRTRRHLSRCTKSLRYLGDLIATRVVHKRIYTHLYGKETLLKKHLQYLGRLPTRDLSRHPRVQNYLKKHKVYISLTTSPLRIKYLSYVLRTLDLTHVEAIYLVLPKVFARDQSTYEIPPELKEFPKLCIAQVEKDLGPITKLIPVAEHLADHDPNSLLITIDDDTGYPRGLVSEMIYWATRFNDAVVGTSGQNLDFFGIPAASSPVNLVKFENSEATPVDVLEGFGAIAYRPGLINTGLMRHWAQKCVACRNSDDLVISMALREQGIARYRMWSPYVNLSNMLQFQYGFGDDALHKGAAREEAQTGENVTHLNYQAAYRTLFGE